MSLIVLPAGQSLRTVADRLGVSVEELQKHSGVKDVEAPLKVDQKVELPDGFLRSRATAKQLKDAVVADSGKRGGMNMWLALDIEQKRTRAAGGMKAHKASSNEEEALAEARRTYLRFEAESNELAIELYGNITSTHSIDVRAQAFAGQACAFAQRFALFGDTVERSRQHALSSAKGALLANPKLPAAHLAMALALQIEPSATDLEEANNELERACDLGEHDAACWAALAGLRELRGELTGASEAAQKALDCDASWLFALENAASLALRRGDANEGLTLLHKAAETVPTYANVHLHLGQVQKAAGQPAEADVSLARAVELATREQHAEAIRRCFETKTFP